MIINTNIQVLYEDNHIIAVNKNCSDIVQGDKTGDEPLSEKVKSYIKHKYNKPGDVYLGVPHRLDRPTSGIVLFARTSKALTRLNNMFKENEMTKMYWAVVDKAPPENKGVLEHFLLRDTKRNKSFAFDYQKKGSKKAKLSYTLINTSDRYFLLEIQLHTGRHHQIRAQLAKIGCHIKGDLKYGFPRSNPNAGIHLHARSMSFILPVKKEPIEIIAPTPDDRLWDAITKKYSI